MERIVQESESFLRSLYATFKNDNPERFQDDYELTDNDFDLYLRDPHMLSEYELSKILEWFGEDKFTAIIKARLA